jgi:hypothetical protein
MLGTYMYQAIGMTKTCEMFAYLNFFVAFISLIFNFSFNPFKENREFNKNLALLRGEEEPLDGKKKNTFAYRGGTLHRRNNKVSSVYIRPKRTYVGKGNSVYNKMHD